jgi:hypothetical protein
MSEINEDRRNLGSPGKEEGEVSNASMMPRPSLLELLETWGPLDALRHSYFGTTANATGKSGIPLGLAATGVCSPRVISLTRRSR